jgi:hypothetical protein
MNRILILSILFFNIFYINSLSVAQNNSSISLTDTNYFNEYNQEEILLENNFEDTEDSKLLDDLDYLKRNPLDLNSVTQQDIESIPFINSFVAKNILEYRESNGLFKSKRELLNIDGINDELYQLIKIYVVVKQVSADNFRAEEEMFSELYNKKFELIKNTDIRFRNRVQQDLQTKKGFLDGSYAGSQSKIFNQLSFKNFNYNLEGNVTIEKDAGESSLTDFSSAYLKIENYKFIKEAVIGDYSLAFGQGLGMCSSTGYSKGSLAVDAVKKRNTGIKGYSSVNESQFFRGAATRLNYKDFDFSLFYSNNFYDASIDTLLNEVSSFYFDGYHRTITEQNRQNSVRERLFGGRIFYDKNDIRLGTTYWTSGFSKPIGTDSTNRLFTFYGDKASMLSFDYDVSYKNANIYGEFAHSQTGSIAALSSLQLNFSNLAEIVFLYRNYPENFSPVHSFGFGENNGNTQNENGIYTGLTINALKNFVINIYYDQFKFPYRTYFNPVATQGNDFLANIDWKFDKNLLFNFKYRNRNKEESQTILDEFGRSVEKIVNRDQINLRIGFNYELTNTINIKTRYEYVYIGYNMYGVNNKGSMFYTDIRFIPMRGLTASARFIFFNTDSYDSRLYEYEDDIRGVMSNTSLYGQGQRWYLMLRYKLVRFFEIYGKYSETLLDGVSTIGTGNDLIQGDVNNRINLGIELHF